MTPQALHKCVIKSKEWANEKVLEVVLELIEDKPFEFESGQFVSLKVSPVNFRAYSIASDYKNPRQITLLAAAAHEGLGSNYLRESAVGTETVFVGPSGKFFLPQNFKNNLIFVSTGTGLAPFLAMFYKLRDLNYSGNITLLQGIRNKSELLKLDMLDQFKSDLENFNYKICMSEETETKDYCVAGRVTEHIVVDQFFNTQYFLCGHPSMVAEVNETLLSEGVLETDIFKEKFTLAKVI